MTIGARAAVSRQMLDHRDDAACKQPLRESPAHRGDPLRTLGKGPGANDGVGHRFGDVQHRRAIDRYPDFGQIMGDQPGDQAGRGLGLGRPEPASITPAAG